MFSSSAPAESIPRTHPRYRGHHQRGRARTSHGLGRTGVPCRRWAIPLQRDGVYTVGDDRGDRLRSTLLGDFLKANVFGPLGMKHTVVYDASRATRHKLAHGYLEERGSVRALGLHPMLTAGDGGLFSTLDDLFHWDQALNAERLVPKARLEQAFTSGTTDDGAPVGYGFGWITNVFPYCNAAEARTVASARRRWSAPRRAWRRVDVSPITTTSSVFSIPRSRSSS